MNLRTLLAASALLAFTHSAFALVFTLNPTADAFITTGPINDLTGNNYGAGGALALSAAGLSKGEFQSVLKFDTSTVVNSFNTAFGLSNWAIDGITITLTAAAPNNSIFNGFGAGSGGSNVNVAGKFSIGWMQNDTWVEGTGTPAAPGASGIMYSTLNSFLGGADVTLGTFAFAGGTSGASLYTLALDTAFATDVAAGGNVSLRVFAADTSVSMVFNSRSFGTSGARPILSISAVAIPESNSVALLALAGLLVSQRRPRHASRH